MRTYLFALLATVIFFVVVVDACTSDEAGPAVAPVTPAPGPPVVASPPIADPVAALGQVLFWDPILSGNKDVACATCHHPDNAYTDGLDLSLGTNAIGYGPNRRFRSPNDISFAGRNAPTILNTAFNGTDASHNSVPATAPMFWDSRVQGLENQVFGPLTTVDEMRGHAFTESVVLDSLVARLSSIAEYRQLFQAAFGREQAITATTISQAIAAFERTLTAMDSPFDRYQRGDKTALTDAQRQGMVLFREEGCPICHAGPLLSDYKLHVMSVPDNAKLTRSDAGAGGSYAFRTPSLRNVGLTAPYMHNGVFQTLKQVLKFYDDIGEPISQNPHVSVKQLDPSIQRISLRDAEQDQVIAFMHALTDSGFDKTIPVRVPSGLNPGGAIR